MSKKELKRSFTFKAKDNEHEAILKWLNGQHNVTDSLRYLIEREIMQNGIRNLQLNIPSDRPFDPFNNNDIYQLDLSTNITSEQVKVLAEQIRNSKNDIFVPVSSNSKVEYIEVQESKQRKPKKVDRNIFSKKDNTNDIDTDDIACWE